MSLHTSRRDLPFLTQSKWLDQYGSQTTPTERTPSRHVETTRSERGRNMLRYIKTLENPKSRANLRKFDWGHYFYSQKTTIDEGSVRYANIQGWFPGNAPNWYSGGLLAVSPTKVHSLGTAEMTETQLVQVLYGAGGTAISKTIPHSSALDLGVTLGELRQDGLPRLPDLTKMFTNLRTMSRDVASDYLNYEFAWKPLIQDILGILSVAARSEEIYEQYKRDSGRPIRRRYSFPDDSRSWVETLENQRPYPPINQYWWNGVSAQNGYGRLVTSYTRSSRTWFAGSYRYHIPEYPGIRGDIAEWQRAARVLLGLEPSPELLWQLTRWSWLVDWFANFGDILANISALGRDNLTLHYGYVMRHSTINATYNWQSYSPVRDPAHDRYLREISTRAVWDQKIRVKASPYGFGVDPGVFTPRQWAILTALGITLAPEKLLS